MGFIHFQTGVGGGGVTGRSKVLAQVVSCVVHLRVFSLFTCLFVFPEADLVTFFGCLC